MIFKSLFTSRKAAPQGGKSDDVGMIVAIMMALVFVPVVAAHAASMWPADADPQQLAGMFSALLKIF
jgi:hypothetical protein